MIKFLYKIINDITNYENDNIKIKELIDYLNVIINYGKTTSNIKYYNKCYKYNNSMLKLFVNNYS